MSIEGRINIDVLFHDKDGTASFKVVSLAQSQSFSGGQVAHVSGTCGTNAVTIQMAPTTYRDASGNTVSFSEIDACIVQASGSTIVLTNPPAEVSAGKISVIRSGAGDFDDSGQLPTVRAATGTASYSIVFVGQ